MNLFKNKQISLKEKDEKNRYIKKFIFLGVFMIFIAIVCICFTENDVIMNNSIAKDIFNIKEKKQIFTYLKDVQPLEDQFYTLVSKNIDLSHKNIHQENKDLLKDNIKAIDEMMIQLANVKTNQDTIENHYLFLDEMKIMRDILLEKNLSIEYNDEKSLTRANAYLEKYFILGQIRRRTLKKVFDKYGIIYLELDNKIKYITE